MHRNTYLLVVFLAVFAALVVGVNIGKRVAPAGTAQTPTPTVTLLPTLLPLQYKGCGISFTYPDTLTIMESASGSALLIDKVNTDQSIVITCQEEIPRPPLSPDTIDTLAISSISAKLYHNASAKDGTPIDELIFRHPKTGLDVFIAGFGSTFDAVIKTVKLIP